MRFAASSAAFLVQLQAQGGSWPGSREILQPFPQRLRPFPCPGLDLLLVEIQPQLPLFHKHLARDNSGIDRRLRDAVEKMA